MSFQLQPSIGKDPNIKDLSKSSVPTQMPSGYRPLQPGEKTPGVSMAAKQILFNFELGDQIPFTADDQQYLGRVEPHYHEPPPPGTDPSEYNRYPKPWGWHKGVTVYKKETAPTIYSPIENYQPERPTSGRLQLLQRIDEILKDFDD